METSQPMDVVELAKFFTALAVVFPESKLEFVEDSAWLKVRYVDDGQPCFVIFSLPMDINLEEKHIRAVCKNNSIAE